MPIPVAIPNFVGGSETQRSVNQSVLRTINLYVERMDGGGLGKNAQGRLQKRPGLIPFRYQPDVFPGCSLAGGPVRGMFYQDNRMFAVGGSSCEEVYQNGTTSVLGTVAVDPFPVTFASNGSGGNQVMLTSGGLGYILDLTTNPATFSQITATDFPARVISCVFLDGYFIALEYDTSKFYLSALYDGTTWNIIDVNQVSGFSDTVQQMGVTHKELWMFGSKHILPYSNTRDAFVPFQPIPGTLIDHGLDAPWSVVNLDNTLWWLGRDEQGAQMIYRADGYRPDRVSQHSLETYLTRAETVRDVIAVCFQFEGHTLYGVYTEHLETTPMYDLANPAEKWTDWALWIPETEQWRPWLGRCHVFAWDHYHLIGDRQSSTIYQMAMPELTTGSSYGFDQIIVGSGL